MPARRLQKLNGGGLSVWSRAARLRDWAVRRVYAGRYEVPRWWWPDRGWAARRERVRLPAARRYEQDVSAVQIDAFLAQTGLILEPELP
jgi:hypothetical protein